MVRAPPWAPGRHWTEDPRVLPSYEQRAHAASALLRPVVGAALAGVAEADYFRVYVELFPDDAAHYAPLLRRMLERADAGELKRFYAPRAAAARLLAAPPVPLARSAAWPAPAPPPAPAARSAAWPSSAPATAPVTPAPAARAAAAAAAATVTPRPAAARRRGGGARALWVPCHDDAEGRDGCYAVGDGKRRVGVGVDDGDTLLVAGGVGARPRAAPRHARPRAAGRRALWLRHPRRARRRRGSVARGPRGRVHRPGARRGVREADREPGLPAPRRRAHAAGGRAAGRARARRRRVPPRPAALLLRPPRHLGARRPLLRARQEARPARRRRPTGARRCRFERRTRVQNRKLALPRRLAAAVRVHAACHGASRVLVLVANPAEHRRLFQKLGFAPGGARDDRHVPSLRGFWVGAAPPARRLS